jgi:hypothetical protein
MDEYEFGKLFVSNLDKLGFRRVKSELASGTYGLPGSPQYERANIWLNEKRAIRASLRAWIAIIIAAMGMIISNRDQIMSWFRGS